MLCPTFADNPNAFAKEVESEDGGGMDAPSAEAVMHEAEEKRQILLEGMGAGDCASRCLLPNCTLL